jgi:hypothetical protein
MTACWSDRECRIQHCPIQTAHSDAEVALGELRVRAGAGQVERLLARAGYVPIPYRRRRVGWSCDGIVTDRDRDLAGAGDEGGDDVAGVAVEGVSQKSPTLPHSHTPRPCLGPAGRNARRRLSCHGIGPRPKSAPAYKRVAPGLVRTPADRYECERPTGGRRLAYRLPRSVSATRLGKLSVAQPAAAHVGTRPGRHHGWPPGRSGRAASRMRIGWLLADDCGP